MNLPFNYLDVARQHFYAKVMAYRNDLENYLHNPVAVGEHPHLSEEVIKLVEKIDNAQSCVNTLDTLINSGIGEYKTT